MIRFRDYISANRDLLFIKWHHTQQKYTFLLDSIVEWRNKKYVTQNSVVGLDLRYDPVSISAFCHLIEMGCAISPATSKEEYKDSLLDIGVDFYIDVVWNTQKGNWDVSHGKRKDVPVKHPSLVNITEPLIIDFPQISLGNYRNTILYSVQEQLQYINKSKRQSVMPLVSPVTYKGWYTILECIVSGSCLVEPPEEPTVDNIFKDIAVKEPEKIILYMDMLLPLLEHGNIENYNLSSVNTIEVLNYLQHTSVAQENVIKVFPNCITLLG